MQAWPENHRGRAGRITRAIGRGAWSARHPRHRRGLRAGRARSGRGRRSRESEQPNGDCDRAGAGRLEGIPVGISSGLRPRTTRAQDHRDYRSLVCPAAIYRPRFSRGYEPDAWGRRVRPADVSGRETRTWRLPLHLCAAKFNRPKDCAHSVFAMGGAKMPLQPQYQIGFLVLGTENRGWPDRACSCACQRIPDRRKWQYKPERIIKQPQCSETLIPIGSPLILRIYG